MKDNKHIQFIFRNMKFIYDIDESSNELDPIEKNKILEKLDFALNTILAEEINIDSTYVIKADSKYQKTFLLEYGWNQLCDILRTTNYGKKTSKANKAMLIEIYRQMIVQFAYQLLSDAGFDITDIMIDLADKTPFQVEIYDKQFIDNYKGKWQHWK